MRTNSGHVLAGVAANQPEEKMQNLPIANYKSMDYWERRKWMADNAIERIPVYKWGEFYYAVYGSIGLIEGVQRLTVFDVTDDLQRPLDQRSNFYITRDGGLIEDYQGKPLDPTTQEPGSFYGSRVDGSFAVLLHSFEDFWTILGVRNGEITTRAGEYREAELPVRMLPPTREQFAKVREQRMDEMEESVDFHGGRVSL